MNKIVLLLWEHVARTLLQLAIDIGPNGIIVSPRYRDHEKRYFGPTPKGNYRPARCRGGESPNPVTKTISLQLYRAADAWAAGESCGLSSSRNNDGCNFD